MECLSQGASSGKASTDACLDSLSYQLYIGMNHFRQDHQLPGIPLSRSLCYVAQVHAKDLTYNRPAVRSCNLHSWSDRGRWTPCCFCDDNPAYACMWNKPKELTPYKFKGYEIIYWQNDNIEPVAALAQWKLQDHFNEMILNKGPWSQKKWRAMGTCIYEGYAIIWLGEESDPRGAPEPCYPPTLTKPDTVAETKMPVSQISPVDSLRYYLIIASLASMEKANQVLLEYHQKGFNKARIITFDHKIRISINDFGTYPEARQVRDDLGPEYRHVWILER
ncbi:MAG: SPOR domain-containing protein [Lentimicrobiaceae bacterium]|nr:SPOR domain-containing protein [Lentimicrobiaceae bacterium]